VLAPVTLFSRDANDRAVSRKAVRRQDDSSPWSVCLPPRSVCSVPCFVVGRSAREAYLARMEISFCCRFIGYTTHIDYHVASTLMPNEIPVTDLVVAREIIRRRLRDQPAESIEIAALLVSELVANALEHGAGTPTLALDVNGAELRGYVRDDDDATQDLAPLSVAPTSERGRGLAIVDALSTQWGVEPRWNGKAVWFSLDLGRPGPGGPPASCPPL
jgi:hypothetical protein